MLGYLTDPKHAEWFDKDDIIVYLDSVTEKINEIVGVLNKERLNEKS